MFFRRNPSQNPYSEILIVFFVTLIIVGAALITAKRYGRINETPEARIMRDIAAANHCETAADCKQVASQCPFGCYVAVHKNAAAGIEKQIQSYQSTCTYSCIEFKGIDCVNNKCEVLTPQP